MKVQINLQFYPRAYDVNINGIVDRQIAVIVIN